MADPTGTDGSVQSGWRLHCALSECTSPVPDATHSYCGPLQLAQESCADTPASKASTATGNNVHNQQQPTQTTTLVVYHDVSARASIAAVAQRLLTDTVTTAAYI